MSCWLHSHLRDLLMSVSAVFLLSSLGIVITVQAQDCTQPVGGPNMGLNDDGIGLNAFPDGTKVTFICNIGYVSAGGSPSITCTAGQWSPLKLTCERKNCGPLKDVPNGQIDYVNGTEFGDTAVVSCKTGFDLVGRREIFCGDRGWMHRPPVCEVVACDPPPGLAQGSFTPVKEHYDYREVIQYRCMNDLTLNGSKSATCSEDATFKPDPPTCIRVECEEPDVKFAKWSGGSRPPYRHKSSVILQCDSGYTMEGSRTITITCEIDNKWSPSLPVCQKSVSPTSPTTRTTTTTTTTTSPPSNEGSDSSTTWVIVVVVIILCCGAVICGCWWCGVPPFFKRKRGTRRGNTDKEATKDGEDVALS